MRNLVIILALFLCLFGLGDNTKSAISGKTHIVEMYKHKFIPKTLELKVGDTVTWINKDRTLHNVVAKKLKIRSRFIRKNEKFSAKITRAGTFNYFCQPHKTMGMVGNLVVKYDNGKQIRRSGIDGVRD